LYWGKIIGFLVGLLSRNPWALIAAIFLGHQFDRGLAERYRSFQKKSSNNFVLPENFIRTLFEAIGYLAKADGRVSEDEIFNTRIIMQRLNLNPSQINQAINWFNEGKSPNYRLIKNIRDLRMATAHERKKRLIFMQLLLEVLFAKKNLKKEERLLLKNICLELKISQIEYVKLEAIIRAQRAFKGSHTGDLDESSVLNAYKTLGISPKASNEEVKISYRRLMNKNHPDKIASRNPSKEEISQAEYKTREVRVAYELLKARRSIR
jgi:DnaJ like chaperone protein